MEADKNESDHSAIQGAGTTPGSSNTCVDSLQSTLDGKQGNQNGEMGATVSSDDKQIEEDISFSCNLMSNAESPATSTSVSPLFTNSGSSKTCVDSLQSTCNEGIDSPLSSEDKQLEEDLSLSPLESSTAATLVSNFGLSKTGLDSSQSSLDKGQCTQHDGLDSPLSSEEDLLSPNSLLSPEESSASSSITTSGGESLRSSMFLPVSPTDYLSPVQSPEDQRINIFNLPEYPLLHIFNYLDIRTLVMSVRNVCRLWHNLSYDRSLWKVLKLDGGGLGEKMTDASFLQLLAPIADLVQELVFGFTMLLTDESFIHKNIYCSKLCTIYFCLTNVTTNAIIYLTEKYPNITALNLNHCSYVNIYKTLDYFVKFQNLQYLSVEDFACDAADGELNEKILNVYQECKNITKGDIYVTELSDEALAKIFACSHKLTDLDITGAYYITAKGFSTLNKNVHTLQCLSIGNTGIGDHALKLIAENSPKLRHLDITSCADISDIGIGYVAAHCPELESLLFNNLDRNEMECNITSVGLKSIALACPKLKKLYASYCQQIDDDCIVAVAENCPVLAELRVNGCLSITDVSLRALAQYSRYLRDLQVSECVQITSKGMGCLLAKCRWLQSVSVTRCARVSNINITKFKDTEAPENHSGSSDVDLTNTHQPSGVDDSDEKEKSLGSLEAEEINSKNCENQMDQVLLRLHNHSHLRVLHLSFCSKITNETVTEIARNSPDLQELSLRGCHLLTDSAIEFLVRACHFLKVLDISGGSSSFSMKISSVSLSAIAHESQYMERLMITKNKLINQAGLEVLFQKCTSLQSLELMVAEPMYICFNEIMVLLNNVNDRIVKIANQDQVITNRQSGNMHIQFFALKSKPQAPVAEAEKDSFSGEVDGVTSPT